MKISEIIGKLRKRKDENGGDLSDEPIEIESIKPTVTGDELDLYQVSDHAWIRIRNTSPPVYEVLEPSLSAGEERLLKEIKSWLY